MNVIDSTSVNTVDASLHEGQVLRKLSDFESLTGRLEPGGRLLDTYELESVGGDQVRLRLTSEEFQVIAFVVLGAAWNQAGREPFVRRIAGGLDRTTANVEAQVPITLPSAGTYRLVVTSLDNETQQRAVSSGEYRMTLLLDTPKRSLKQMAVTAPVVAPSPSVADTSGPGSQKGARFNAWESDSP